MTSPAPPAPVAETLAGYPAELGRRLMEIRALIFDEAAQNPAIGPVQECLKWGEPAYLTPVTGSGSTLRLGPVRDQPDMAGLFVNCRTLLVDRFRTELPDAFRYRGDRAVLVPLDGALKETEMRRIIGLGLTYHRWAPGWRKATTA